MENNFLKSPFFNSHITSKSHFWIICSRLKNAKVFPFRIDWIRLKNKLIVFGVTQEWKVGIQSLSSDFTIVRHLSDIKVYHYVWNDGQYSFNVARQQDREYLFSVGSFNVKFIENEVLKIFRQQKLESRQWKSNRPGAENLSKWATKASISWERHTTLKTCIHVW